jgi:porin
MFNRAAEKSLSTARAGILALSISGFAAHAVPTGNLPEAAEPAPADSAPKPVAVSASWVSDVIGIAQSGTSRPIQDLNKASLTAELDLDQVAHWHGATALVTLQGTFGATPNVDLGSLQGIDNNEANDRRLRLFEAWIEQQFGENVALKVGLIDQNTEFYANHASALLIGPEFGTPSEIAATGPGGPSVFPQSALAARLEIKPADDLYLHLGVFNAHVGDPGDTDGVDFSFDEGVMWIAEGGWAADGNGKLALGVWGYSKKQDDLFDVDSAGDPVGRNSRGAYLVSEKVFLDGGDNGTTWSAFFRGGISDGDTGPFKGSWAVGALASRIIPSRPDSQLSFAYDRAYIGDKYRLASAAGGTPLGNSESRVELTYSDTIFDHFTIQPDLQYIDHPGGDPTVPGAFVGMVRLTLAFGS